MLAGAMMQSLILAGNSGGDRARRSKSKPGFTDRLFAAPISRYTIVLGRLAGTAALGLFGSLWFLTIGLVFGAEIAGGVPGALVAISLAIAAALAIGGIGASVALRTGNASIVQGLFPLVFVVLFLSTAFFPLELMIEPAKTIAAYNPLSFVVEGIREPIVSGLNGTDVLDAALAIIGIGLISFLSARALRHRLRTAMEAAIGSPGAQNLATISALTARASNELLSVPGAVIPGVLAPTIFFLGINGVFGGLTPLTGFTTDSYPSFVVPVSVLQGGRLHRRRDRRQPRARHRTGLARPAARLPRPALGAARGDRPLGQHQRAHPGHLRARGRPR